jgi:hypothetical protein
MKTTNDSSNKIKYNLLEQAQLCLDNKKLDDYSKTKSLMTSGPIQGDNDAQERRRIFAKSKTMITPINDKLFFLP